MLVVIKVPVIYVTRFSNIKHATYARKTQNKGIFLILRIKNFEKFTHLIEQKIKALNDRLC